MVGFSETRRPGSGETNSKGFTYYWSGMSNGHHVKGVAIGIASRLQPSVVEVTLVDERIMRLKLKQCMLPPRRMKLKRRCSTPNTTLYETNVPVVMHSLSWATLMLSLALKGLAMKYVLGPMVLVRGMTTALSF